MKFSSLLTLAATTALVLAVDTIEVVGNKFFYSNNGSQFFIRGVAYQEDVTTEDSSLFTDPLADADACTRDVAYLSKVNTNVVRVYAVNTTLDHSSCMSTLADAGIYVILDLSEPDESIDRDSPSWTLDLYTRYTDVVDAFHNYTNVLGFFAGNEVTNNASNTDASAFVKAAVRDTKAYIKDQGYRTIPVGYSLNDDADIRVAIANYFACGDEDERADFYGINMYEWCGKLSYSASGYEDRTEEMSNMTVPIFFSEYGCNTVTPRTFTEIQALFGENMTLVWSGGIVYMYFEESNDYGLVLIVSSKVLTLTDYSYYLEEINSILPLLTALSVYTSEDALALAATMACPTAGFEYWTVATSLPPTPNELVCDCMVLLLLCIVDDLVLLDDYATLYAYVCGEILCSAVTANGTLGSYGAYSFCSSKDKLLYVLNAYYVAQGSDDLACSFSGLATLQSAATGSTCASVSTAAASGSTTSKSGSTASGLTTSSTSNAAMATGSGFWAVWAVVVAVSVGAVSLM